MKTRKVTIVWLLPFLAVLAAELVAAPQTRPAPQSRPAPANIPALIETVRSGNEVTASTALDTISKSPNGKSEIVKLLRSDDEKVAGRAFTWVRTYWGGPIRLIRDPEFLAMMRNEVIPLFVARILDEHDKRASSAADLIGHLRLPEELAKPLTNALADANTPIVVRQRVADLIARDYEPSAAAVAAMKSALHAKEAPLRDVALHFFIQKNSDGREVFEAMQDPDLATRLAAIFASPGLLSKRAATPDQLNDALMIAFRDEDHRVTRAAVTTMARIGNDSFDRLMSAYAVAERVDQRAAIEEAIVRKVDEPGMLPKLTALIDSPQKSMRLTLLAMFSRLDASKAPIDRIHFMAGEDDYDIARAACVFFRDRRWEDLGPVTRARVESPNANLSSTGDSPRFRLDPFKVTPQQFPAASTPTTQPSETAAPQVTAEEGPSRPNWTSLIWLATLGGAGCVGVVLLAKWLASAPTENVRSSPDVIR